MCELLAPRTSRRYLDTHFKGRRTIRMIGVLAIAELSSFVGWFPYDHLDLSSRPQKKNGRDRKRKRCACRRSAVNNVRLKQNFVYFIFWLNSMASSISFPRQLLFPSLEREASWLGKCARLLVHFFVVTARLRHDFSRFVEDFFSVHGYMDLKNSTPIKLPTYDKLNEME